MHRSGTSLVTRIFYLMGCDLGNPESFYPPDSWNPDGYFEQKDIHKINMPLVNGMFGKFSYFSLPSTDTILKRGRKMSNLIKDTYLKYNGVLVKETRFCLTMPAWIAEGAKFEKVIICLRHPFEVANSIQKRNHTILKHGYYLFNVHNERILQHTQQANSKIWIVSYANLLKKDHAQNEIEGALDFMEIKYSKEDLDQCLRKIIRSPRNKIKDLNVKLPTKTNLIYQNLLEQHKSQFS